MEILAECDVTVDVSGQAICGARRIGDIQGRRLAWLELGNPSGMPVLYAHGNPGSGLELFFWHHVAARRRMRLFAVDRPGFGYSDYQSDATLLSVAQDMLAVADHHQLNRILAIGWSSGGPPAMTLARYHPDRLAALAVLSSFTNFGELPTGPSLLAREEKIAAQIAEKSPHLFRGLVRAIGWTSRKLPDVYMNMAEADVGDADRQVLQDTRRFELFERVQESSFRQGADGAIRDLEVQWREWPFNLGEITVPTTVFQGERDQFVPAAFGEHIAGQISGARLHRLPECGHLYPLLADYQRLIFDELEFLTTKKPA